MMFTMSRAISVAEINFEGNMGVKRGEVGIHREGKLGDWEIFQLSSSKAGLRSRGSAGQVFMWEMPSWLST